MMDKDLLRNIPLFAQLSDEDRGELAALMQERALGPNEVVFWIGEKGEELFVVQRGQVRLSYPDENGAEVTVAVLGPGNFLGEISLLDGGPRTATARTEHEASLVVLDRKSFYQFLETHPPAAVHMIAVLGHRQRDAMAKLRKIRNVNEVVEERVTPLQRAVDRAATIGASGAFLMANLIFITGWITFHSLTYSAARERNPALPPIFFNDTPPTFFWLCLMIGLESILLTMFVLNSQRRQAERDRIRSDFEYQVNLKAQLEIMQLHQKMDRLQEVVAGGGAGAAPADAAVAATGEGAPGAAPPRA